MDSNGPAAPLSGKNVNAEASVQAASVAKNTSYFTAALLFQKLLSLVYFVYATRSIGDGGIGDYLAALAVTTVFGVFIDVGFNQVLIRETAKQPGKAHAYLESSLTLKLFLALLAYAAAQAYVLLFHFSPERRDLVFLTGIVMVLDSLALSFYAIFRGFRKLKYEAIGTIVNKLVVVGVGVIGLRLGYGARFLVLSILVGSAFNVVYALALLVKKTGWRPRLGWNAPLMRTLWTIAAPFAVASILITVYGYLDQNMLSNPLLVGSEGKNYITWYGTAYKLTFALQFIPAALAAAIFPAMSTYFQTDKEQLRRTFERGMHYLLVLIVPIVLGVIVIAHDLILHAYGIVFEPATEPLRVLVISLAFIFMNYPVGYLLNAADRQTRNTVHTAIALVMNFLLNLFLIPKFGFMGAAYSSLASNALLFVLGMSVAGEIVAYRKRRLLRALAQSAAAALPMAAAMQLLHERLALLPTIAVGGALYFIFLFAFGGVTLLQGRALATFIRSRMRRA